MFEYWSFWRKDVMIIFATSLKITRISEMEPHGVTECRLDVGRISQGVRPPLCFCNLHIFYWNIYCYQHYSNRAICLSLTPVDSNNSSHVISLRCDIHGLCVWPRFHQFSLKKTSRHISSCFHIPPRYVSWTRRFLFEEELFACLISERPISILSGNISTILNL